MPDLEQFQRQTQSQKQIQKMSARQIQALTMLRMNCRDLREEIYKAAADNPALEIVEPKKNQSQSINGRSAGTSGYDSAFEAQREKNERRSSSSKDYEAILEAQEGHKETLQQHLMSQLNMINLSADEYSICQKLIFNLDKNGCYGSMLAPETLLDKARPLQNKRLLERCIERIQQMDPVGVCCKTPEESLFVQAKIAGDASELTLFLLDGHLEFLNPPTTERVLHKLNEYVASYNKKSFGAKLPFDQKSVNAKRVEESIAYILKLNPRPAGEYISDVSTAEFDQPDVVLQVNKVEGHLFEDDFAHGKVAAPGSFYFQVKYASGILPEVRVVQNAGYDKSLIEQAQNFLGILQFRENTIVLQGCAIVSAQKDFFEKGPGNISPLTRRQIAERLQIHESTVSRMAGKKSNKYIQTEWGLYPASYFFSSGVGKTETVKSAAETGGKTETLAEGTAAVEKKADWAGGIKSALISAEAIQFRMSEILEVAENNDQKISDNQLTKLLNEQGIKIARRTVTKYRERLGLKNSYGK